MSFSFWIQETFSFRSSSEVYICGREYHETFKNNAQLIEHFGILVGLDPATYKVAMEYLGNDINLETPGQIK